MNFEQWRVAYDKSPNFPDQMGNARRWMLWKQEANKMPGKKPRKVPYYVDGTPRSGATDSSEDQRKFGTLYEAFVSLLGGDYAGLGFALGPDGTGNHWQGIDLDKLSEKSHLANLADNLPGYVETSPSGDGRHAIGYGRKFKTLGSNESGAEAYCKSRYFTMTGNVVGSGKVGCIAYHVENAVAPIHSRHRKPAGTKTEPRDRDIAPPNEDQSKELRSALNHLDEDSYDHWQRAGHALKTAGNVGFELWNEWSSLSEKYDSEEALEKWDTFRPDRTNWKSVFKMANEEGWRNEFVNRSSQLSIHSDQPEFVLRQACDIIRELKPPQWLIKGLIEENSLAMLFGPPSSGKSVFAMDISCRIATGSCFQDHDVQKGPVIYIAGEGKAGWGRRITAWSTHNKVELDDAPLFASEAAASFMDAKSANAVIRSVDALAAMHGEPSLIVVDTLARNFGDGDENSNSDVGTFIKRMDAMKDAYNATVLIVHHSGLADPTRARGASALLGACDAAYQISNNSGRVKITAQKMKESELPDSIHLRMEQISLGEDDDGKEFTSAVLIEGGPCPQLPKSLSEQQELALEAFKEACKKHGNLDDSGVFAGIHVDKWRAEFYEKCGDKKANTKRQTFLRSKNALDESGLVAIENDICRPAGATEAFEMTAITDAIRARGQPK